MRKFQGSFALFALLSLTFGQSFAAPTPAIPVACMNYAVTQNATRSFGVPLLDLPKFTGFATAVTTNVITVTGVTWTANQFVTSGPHFVSIRTGQQAGRTLLVSANTTNTLTVSTEDTALNASGFVFAANTDSFELYAGDTLGTLFGSTADGSGNLTSGVRAGTSIANADNIQVWSGTAFVTYYFSTTLGFWIANGGTTNQNGVILYPDDGFLILRRGPTGNLTMAGRVPSTKQLTKFNGGTTNVITVRFPASTTLGTLNFGAPGTWLTGANDTVADTVSLWNGTAWVVYYKNTSNLWIQVGGTGTDQSAVAIPSGTSIRIAKKGTVTGVASFFGQNLPYSL